MDENEPLDQAAARELQEETSVDPADVLLTQVGACSWVGMPPVDGKSMSKSIARVLVRHAFSATLWGSGEKRWWCCIPTSRMAAFPGYVLFRRA